MKVLKRRWLELLSYCGLTLVNGLAWCTLTSISSSAESYYGVSTDLINLYEMTYFIMYLPFAPLSSWCLGKSFYWCMHFAWAITTVGVWLRVLAGSNFFFSLLGQFFIASLNSLTLPACSTLASVWFKQDEQVFATTVGSLSNFIGIGLGFILPPYIKDIPDVMMLQAVIASAFAVLNLLFSSKEPKQPTDELGFIEGIKTAMKNKNLLGIVLCSSSGVAVSYTMLGIMGEILAPSGMESKETGWIGFSIVNAGMVGGLIATFLVKKFKAILMPLRIFLLLSIVSIIFWAAVIWNLLLAIIGSVLVGFTIIGFVPLGIRAAVEQNQEIEESIPTNMIFFTAQILSLIYTYPLEYFNQLTHLTGLWIAAMITFVSFVAFLMIYKKKNINEVSSGLLTI